MKWNNNAEKALSKVPFFVRKRVKRRVEEEAVRLSANEVTLEHVRSCQKRFLNKMEDEVKGFQLETCFGQTGCPNRAVNSDGLPERLERNLAKRKLKSFIKERVNGPLKMHHEFRISISDCPNACSRPQIVDIGLIGSCKPKVSDKPCTQCSACVEACKEDAVFLADDRPFIDDSKCLYCGQCARVCPTGTLQERDRGYRILIGGKLGRHPRLGVELPGVYDPTQVLEFVDLCLNHYQKHCQKGERFGVILEREGLESFVLNLKKGKNC
jgi:dissimilatory sulfite reductase (desulfoviridin) alpha/beta subunit